MEYKHTAKVSRDAWYIKFFCWMWWAEPDSLDFCKLFWGYLFAIPNLVLRLIASPFYFILIRPLIRYNERAMKEEQELTLDEWEEREKISKVKREARQKKVNKFFGAVSHFFATRTARIMLGILIVVLCAVGLALVGFSLYLIAVLIIENLVTTLVIIGALVGTLVLIAGLIIGVSAFSRTELAGTLATGLKEGKHTFSGSMRHGYHGLKTNTCPKIELVD